MKRTIFFLVLLFAFASTSSAFDIRSYCREVSDAVGGSYQIEETCIEQELQAKENLSRMSIPSRIENYCRKVGQAVGGSYQIMETCVSQELAAKNRVGQL
jgi:hypothetical protein